MKFFNGFSLQNEEYLFDEFINKSAYSVCGFSYGAIKAFEYVNEQLELGNRVDTLQLLSPAFFQTKNDKFKRLQSLSHSKNRLEYIRQFIDGCFYPYEKKIVESKKTTKDELNELLNYEWNIAELKKLRDRGVKIEVYLGDKDTIIDVQSARELFLHVATLTYIKDANHFLQVN